MPKLLIAFASAALLLTSSGIWKSQRGDNSQCRNPGTSNEVLCARLKSCLPPPIRPPTLSHGYRRGYYGYGYGYRPYYGYGYGYRPYGYYGYGWRPGITIGIGRGWGWRY